MFHFLILLSLFVVRYINQNKQRIIEGELRCDGLKQYLERLQLPMCVWLCEDGSGINAKIEFDPTTNQMVGLVLPINSTGMPVPFQFLAKSADEILKHVNKPTSKLVYIVLAQPLLPNVPPFLLQIFGTDNKFTTINVIERWKFIKAELEKYLYTHSPNQYKYLLFWIMISDSESKWLAFLQMEISVC